MTGVHPDTVLLLAHAFDDLNVGRVQAATDARNSGRSAPSPASAPPCEDTLRRYQRRSDGSVCDSVLFSFTAEDWPVVPAGLVAKVSTCADHGYAAE